MNDQNMEWINPSKSLVDKALERWSTKKMRADNTSVVIIMLDPPGPPKREVLKSNLSQPYSMDYLSNWEQTDNEQEELEAKPNENFTMYDHSTNEHIDLDGIPLPTNGLAIMTRYENAGTSDIVPDKHQSYVNIAENANNSSDVLYMSSFAESYNSLLNSSLENDHSYIYNNDMQVDPSRDDDDFDEDSGDGSNFINNPNSQMDSYSLTKLQTRSEQQISIYEQNSNSSHSMGSMFEDYQQNLKDHNYFSSSTTSYSNNHHNLSIQQCETLPNEYEMCKSIPTLDFRQHEVNANDLMQLDSSNEQAVLHDLHPNNYYSNQKVLINPNDLTIISNCSSGLQSAIETLPKENSNFEQDNKKCEYSSTVDAVKRTSADNANHLDDSMSSYLEDSIQIHEISSSNAHQAHDECESKELISGDENVDDLSTEQNIFKEKRNIRRERTSQLVSTRTTRSSSLATRNGPVLRKSTANRKQLQGLKVTLKAIIQNGTSSGLTKNKRHKENCITIVRKVRHTIDETADLNQIQTRNTPIQTLSHRTLRSRNAKDNIKLGNPVSSVITIAATTSTPANSSSTRNHASKMSSKLVSGVNSCHKSISIIRKPPKRLSDTVQMIAKNDINSSKSKSDCETKSSAPPAICGVNQNFAKKTLSATSTPTLRCKMLVTNKSMVIQRCNELVGNVGTQMITRRMRLQQ